MTPKQKAFVREYLIDLCATKAAERVGYSGKHVKKTACELMAKPEIQAAIAEAMKERERRTLITADKVLLDIQDIGNTALRAGEFTAALRSRELLGKHLKLFTERHEHGGIGGGPVQVSITEKEADL
jgi:phage terminase small subunit